MKRLILCCDGTWLDSAMGLRHGNLPIPSNVTRISQAIKPVSASGITQVIYYQVGLPTGYIGRNPGSGNILKASQAGVGSTGNFLNRIVGGATAEGISDNIRSGYSFIANNYAAGDEIILFGFSRGAFTVRSIAELIDGVGLLTKTGLPFLAAIFKDFKNRRNPKYRPVNPDLPFPNRPSADGPTYREQLRRRGLSRLDIAITAVGVWDTIGSLGIPRIGWLERLHLQTRSMKEYLFEDTTLNNHILNAFQALALDEHRAAFQPAVWEKPPGNTTNLRQVWFPGVHQNIGGGYADQGQANITLAWMMAQVGSFIDFSDDHLLELYDETKEYYDNKGEKPRPWSFGKIYRSMTGIYILDGKRIRTPGGYRCVEPETGRSTGVPLRETHEYIHPSTRSRKVLRGPGISDDGRYDCHPLDPYKLRTKETADRRASAFWQLRRQYRGTRQKELPESPLWGIEKELLAESPRMYDYLLSVSEDDESISPPESRELRPRARG